MATKTELPDSNLEPKKTPVQTKKEYEEDLFSYPLFAGDGCGGLLQRDFGPLLETKPGSNTPNNPLYTY